MKSGDNHEEYRRRTLQGRLEGLFYLGCIVFALAIALMARGLP